MVVGALEPQAVGVDLKYSIADTYVLSKLLIYFNEFNH